MHSRASVLLLSCKLGLPRCKVAGRERRERWGNPFHDRQGNSDVLLPTISVDMKKLVTMQTVTVIYYCDILVEKAVWLLKKWT